jgi:hypothetical protein
MMILPCLNKVSIQYNTIQYNTIQYNTIQYNTIQYNTIQYNTIQYNTIQYSIVQYSTNRKENSHTGTFLPGFHTIPQNNDTQKDDSVQKSVTAATPWFAMIRHQNAGAMVLASALISPWTATILNIIREVNASHKRTG